MNIFSYIKSHVPILEVISGYVTLKRMGGYWKGPCPFHQERTASFTVSPAKDIFYCFGCHVGGDVIAFTAKLESCSHLQAAHMLAEKFQLELPEQIRSNISSSMSDKEQHTKICTLFAQWCAQELEKHHNALNYLKLRTINAQSLSTFCLGYVPSGSSGIKNLVQTMSQHNIMAKDLIQSGIVQEGKHGLYCPFEDRIIFPIKDLVGRICGFGGRVFKTNDTRAKYYNSKEHAFFDKGTILFGIDQAKKSMQSSGYVTLVEGYMDCIAMVQHGYTNTVATLGTACTQMHLEQLARFVPKVIILYDSDKAGQQALIRLAHMCWSVNLELYVARLQAGHDPASYLAAGLDIRPALESATPIMTFFISTIGDHYENMSLADKMDATQKIIEVIAKTPNLLRQELLLEQACSHLNLPIGALRQELKKYSSGDIPEPSTVARESLPVAPETIDVHEDKVLEEKIFYAIMNNINLFRELDQDFLINFMAQPFADILKLLQHYSTEHNNITFGNFFDTLDDSSKQLVSQHLLKTYQETDLATTARLVLFMKKRYWKEFIGSLKKRISQAEKEKNFAKAAALVQQFVTLKKEWSL
ncbi:hypothetical protein J120_00830 [candidate division TM6 bacterium JCVI TM6SC1]|uniref:DNA primase n=1 Tax=candidate division TM6 bacterium JCVI TM6SC1 TaxID=1306947 RepID=A0A0D2JMB5_9BACT|nr:hypothetical protein J120_00830 [candidate division TM6 bacterium JCVI TM6SC1]